VVYSSLTPNILAISFYYPPANNPRAIQVARLLRHTDLPITLVCASYADKKDRRDGSLEREARASLHKLVEVPFSVSTMRSSANRLAGLFVKPFWNELPDDSRSWKGKVVASIAECFERMDHSRTVLVSFGSPMSDHLIGLELKKHYGVPWLAHFSDPWADNPFKSFNWLTKRANLALERSVMEAADRLLFTSEETIDLVMAKYPDSFRSRTRVVPHSYEPSKYSSASVSSQITIRFLGDMYGSRTPKPLFAALLSILKDDEQSLKDVSFEFVGSMCELDLSTMGLSDLPAGLVVLRDTVPNRESLSLMSSADGLMVIDAPAEMSVFLPSKLIDYLGAGRPILGITPPGTASKLISELGGWTGNPSDAASVKEAVRLFVEFLRGKRQTGFPGSTWGLESLRKQFEAQSVGAEFRKLVSELA
jgi:hypothetical protein